MLNNQNISLNNFSQTYHHPQANNSVKKTRKLFKMVKKDIKNFDRSFDNTVVDTYAFYKVINSDFVINYIFEITSDIKLLKNNDLISLENSLTKYILTEVKKIYKNTNHHIHQSEVYFNYVDKLIDTIIKSN